MKLAVPCPDAPAGCRGALS